MQPELAVWCTLYFLNSRSSTMHVLTLDVVSRETEAAFLRFLRYPRVPHATKQSLSRSRRSVRFWSRRFERTERTHPSGLLPLAKMFYRSFLRNSSRVLTWKSLGWTWLSQDLLFLSQHEASVRGLSLDGRPPSTDRCWRKIPVASIGIYVVVQGYLQYFINYPGGNKLLYDKVYCPMISYSN